MNTIIRLADRLRQWYACMRNRHAMLRVGTFLVSYRQFGYFHCAYCSHVEVREDRKVVRRVTPYPARRSR